MVSTILPEYFQAFSRHQALVCGLFVSYPLVGDYPEKIRGFALVEIQVVRFFI
jgi:hypothetical protein